MYAWDAKDGKIVRQLKGHAHWVNTLALSSEFALRTGAFDETGKREGTFEKAKERALERYKKLTRNKPERLISGSDDFTMFLWEPSQSKTALKRLTGHVQLINHVMFSPDGKYFASASFDKAVKLWNGETGDFVCTFRGHVGRGVPNSLERGFSLVIRIQRLDVKSMERAFEETRARLARPLG